MIKNNLLDNLNKLIREDEYIISLCNNIGIELDKVSLLIENIYKNLFFTSLDEKIGIPLMLNLLKLTLNENLTTEEKQQAIQAKWKAKGNCTEKLLQTVCDSWKNGIVDVDFINDNLTLNFVGVAGIPSDLESLKAEVNKTKPAYLLVDYIFHYLYWDLWDSWDLTWDEFESKDLSWDELEITIFKP